MISHGCRGINRNIRAQKDERRSNGRVDTFLHVAVVLVTRDKRRSSTTPMMVGNKLGNGPFIG